MAAPEKHPADHAPGPARRLGRAWTSLPAEERVAALAALALWGSMFLPWYGKSVTETVRGSLRAAGYTLSAFGAFSFVEAAVLLVASSVLALLFARAERRAFHLPGGDGSVILVAGVWTSLLVFYRMLDKPGTTGNAQLTTTIGLQWGIFVAMAAAIALAYAGTRLRTAHRPEPARVEDPTLTPYPPPPADDAPHAPRRPWRPVPREEDTTTVGDTPGRPRRPVAAEDWAVPDDAPLRRRRPPPREEDATRVEDARPPPQPPAPPPPGDAASAHPRRRRQTARGDAPGGSGAPTPVVAPTDEEQTERLLSESEAARLRQAPRPGADGRREPNPFGDY